MDGKRTVECETPAKKQRHEYGCGDCGQTFAHKRSLNHHKKTAHATNNFKCQLCEMTFSRRDNLERHQKKHVQQGGAHEVELTAKEGTPKAPFDPPCDLQALGGTVQVHTIPAEGIQKYDPMTFLKGKYDEIKKVLKQAIKDRGGLKWYLTIKVKMSRWKREMVETVEPHFRGKCQVNLKFEDLDESLRESIKKIYTSFIEFQRQDSNWTVDSHGPLQTSSWLELHPPPYQIEIEACHRQCSESRPEVFHVVSPSSITPSQTTCRAVARYDQHISGLDFTGVSFPVKLADVPRFENQNQISINVFGYEMGGVYPLHVTKQRFDRHVDLLMIVDSKKSHFCWIKDLNWLLFDQKTHANRYHYCPYCLQGFTKQRVLDDHLVYCQTHGNLTKEGPSKFIHITQHFDADQLPLLLRKQVYPYEYFDSEDKFIETQLPHKEAFRSSLTQRRHK